MIPNPSEYNLPHATWRDGQFEIVEKILNKRNGSVTILQAPTGSGKSSIAKAVGAGSADNDENEFGGVTTLVATKALQDSVYRELNFDILFGRANYPCVHPSRARDDSMANECLYENMMDKCEYAKECPYLVQKELVKNSSYRSLNYAYMQTARWPRLKENATEYLFLDECHLLPDQTLEFVSCTVRDGERERYDLPPFPPIYDSTKADIEACIGWLSASAAGVEEFIGRLKKDDTHFLAKKSKAERFLGKIRLTGAAMKFKPEDWYVRGGQRAVEFRGMQLPGLIAKPLTARHHFSRLFLNIYPKTVLMSATIGNVEAFTEELGIQSYEFEKVPNQWPPESRPVHVLDVPPMGRSAKESAFDLQAEKIAGVLKELPDFGHRLYPVSACIGKAVYRICDTPHDAQ